MNNKSNIRICALPDSIDFAKKVEQALLKKGASKGMLVSIERVDFSNGEGAVKIKSGIRQKDVIIMADIGNYSSTYLMREEVYPMSPEMIFMNIERTLSAIRNDARRKIIIMPLLYASRQDKRGSRESLDCAMALQKLESMGVDNIITFDIHNEGVINAIPNTSIDVYYASHLITEQYITDKGGFGNIVVVGPDSGALKRAIYYAGILEAGSGVCFKQRDYSKMEKGKHPIIHNKQNYMGVDVEGKDVFIVDDMICSGSSIWEAVDTMVEQKCKSISVAATFAFFTEGVEAFDEAFEEGILKKVYTTNLSYIPQEIVERPWIEVIDCSEYVADIIFALINNESMEKYIDMKDYIIEFKKNY